MGTSGRALSPHRVRVAFFITLRVLVISLLCTLLAFAAGLFIGILGVIVANAVAGHQLSLAAAYRTVAFPLAVVTLVSTLAVMTVVEYRNARKGRTRLA